MIHATVSATTTMSIGPLFFARDGVVVVSMRGEGRCGALRSAPARA